MKCLLGGTGSYIAKTVTAHHRAKAAARAAMLWLGQLLQSTTGQRHRRPLSAMGSSGQQEGLGAAWQQHRGRDDSLAEHFPMHGAAACPGCCCCCAT